FNMIGSDAMALINQTDEFYEINDKEYLIIDKDKISIFDKNGNSIKRDTFKSSINNQDINLGVYDHYMLKEIDEQPSVIRKIVKEYIADDKLQINQEILDELNKADRLYIIASGTSMHAGLVGKHMIEELAKKPVEVHLGSEFGYNRPLLSERPLFIFISQSGETADSRVALQSIKDLGFKTLTITNVAGSTLARESDYNLLLHAGPEIAVASTKAYVAQTTLLALLANHLGNNKLDIQLELSKVVIAIEDIISKKTIIKEIVADKIMDASTAFYIGRGVDYCTALEAALKLKEISYIHTEGFASGELKHGTIALIENSVPVIGIISQDNIALNTRSALQEVEARDAKVITIVQERLSNKNDDIIVLDTNPLLSSIAMVVASQLISYYAALLLEHDVDQPRNLAKSVTVE
ncbi:MAG: glutamine--fructose-6-phosphate transaminase (isomerizing), partial [Erysipelotrichales bacterium]